MHSRSLTWMELREDNVCAAVNEHPKDRKYEYTWLDKHLSATAAAAAAVCTCMADAHANV